MCEHLNTFKYNHFNRCYLLHTIQSVVFDDYRATASLAASPDALYIEAHAPHSFQSVLKRIQLLKGCLCHLQFQRANRRHVPNSYTRFLNRFKMANPFMVDAVYCITVFYNLFLLMVQHLLTHMVCK